jgi:hypothetical protein
MIGYFFDINVLLKVENKIWLINQSNPNVPILKLSKEEFKAIKKGIYKNQDNKVYNNGEYLYFPKDITDFLEKKKIKLSDIGFGFQEFTNPSIIKYLKFEINTDNISFLKNKTYDVYIICSNIKRKSYGMLISKLEESLKNLNINLKGYIYIPEDTKNDFSKHEKVKILMENSIGYKISGNRFIDEENQKYDKVYFYDNDIEDISDELNATLYDLMNNTESGLKDVIKEDLKDLSPKIEIVKVTDNVYNRFKSKVIELELFKFIRKFKDF